MPQRYRGVQTKNVHWQIAALCKLPDGGVDSRMWHYLHTDGSIDDLLGMWEVRDYGLSWHDAMLANQQAARKRRD